LNDPQNSLFNKAFAAWQAQNYPKVLKLLGKAKDAQSLHLRGLAARRLGQTALARTSLKNAVAKDPQNAEIHHNYALVEMDADNPHAALPAVLRALKHKKNWAAAKRTQGRILHALERWQDAITIYDNILDENPEDQITHFGRAKALMELGQAERAEAAFNQLIEAGLQDPAGLFMRARARQSLGQAELARRDFEQAFAAQPNAIFLRETARHLWTMQEHEAFKTLLHEPFGDESLRICAGELLRQSGDFAHVKTVLVGDKQSADALSILAWSALDQTPTKETMFAEARALAERAVQLSPDHAGARAAIVTSLCGMNQAQEAQPHIDHMRSIDPDGQHWIAYQLLIWRLLADTRYQDWMDYDHLVQVYELSAPPGYASLQTFNQALAEALLELHNHRCHPIDQSLRAGSQTRNDLQHEKNPVIQQYLRALEAPINQYLQHIGNDAGHPLANRNTGRYSLAGCWSVKLNGGGHHINHVHPQGWISSAYYVRVPESDPESKSGWIKFGEPAYPTSLPEHWVEPLAGRLVLFPSYLWHGTNPTTGDALRLTAPFDIVPKTNDERA